jgi:hypothetical protein
MEQEAAANVTDQRFEIGKSRKKYLPLDGLKPKTIDYTPQRE